MYPLKAKVLSKAGSNMSVAQEATPLSQYNRNVE